MPTDAEKRAFSDRLRLALRRADEPIPGPTELALQFNLRHRTGTPISAQTAHKWLSGRAIPTPDKIATLAEWLHVTEHWLHHGPPPTTRPAPNKRSEKVAPEALALAIKIQELTAHRRYLVEELVEQLRQDLG
ncbi:transcriptional regulator [Ralstonia sp. CHL-2022]|uniref:Transcriptional regulator n=1 Tax=Ralstonia mojiangensis TaxID=2953895 RepID=A0ABT2L4M3_9RALS|nr:transcriptional regulator [Ralstonia mojiangensis]MCT7310084.1 transcriptional regulator [Ralstonia mojiangensis]